MAKTLIGGLRADDKRKIGRNLSGELGRKWDNFEEENSSLLNIELEGLGELVA